MRLLRFTVITLFIALVNTILTQQTKPTDRTNITERVGRTRNLEVVEEEYSSDSIIEVPDRTQTIDRLCRLQKTWELEGVTLPESRIKGAFDYSYQTYRSTGVANP